MWVVLAVSLAAKRSEAACANPSIVIGTATINVGAATTINESMFNSNACIAGIADAITYDATNIAFDPMSCTLSAAAAAAGGQLTTSQRCNGGFGQAGCLLGTG